MLEYFLQDEAEDDGKVSFPSITINNFFYVKQLKSLFPFPLFIAFPFFLCVSIKAENILREKVRGRDFN